VTDPGGIVPALFLGYKPVVADAKPGAFNVGADEFEAALTPETKAAVITHLGGIPVDIDSIIEIATARRIPVIEDCSQAHGALFKGMRVGRFGDIAFFSTMFSKNHASGGCGGLVFTENQELYKLIRSHADRGKPFFKEDFNPKDPGQFLFAALNLNQDEVSCAIGLSTLKKLQGTIERRLKIVNKINEGLSLSEVVSPISVSNNMIPSPFFLTVNVNTEKLGVPKEYFANAIAAEGIWINADYKYVVSEWDWIKEYFPREMHTPNATYFRDHSFNILFNERFGDKEIEDIIACILKVEKILAR